MFLVFMRLFITIQKNISDFSNAPYNCSVVLTKIIKLVYVRTQIVAVDGGRPMRSGTTTVEVSVLDSNDNSPQFEQLAYEVFIYENEPAGTLVIQVQDLFHFL